MEPLLIKSRTTSADLTLSTKSSKGIVVLTIDDCEEKAQIAISREQAKDIRKHLKKAFNLGVKQRTTSTI